MVEIPADLGYEVDKKHLGLSLTANAEHHTARIVNGYIYCMSHTTVRPTRTARMKTYGKSFMKTLKASRPTSSNLATASLSGNSESTSSCKEYGLKDQEAPFPMQRPSRIVLMKLLRLSGLEIGNQGKKQTDSVAGH